MKSDMAEPVDKPFGTVASDLVAVSRRFYDQGWMRGTSGNLSAVVREDPLVLAITPSGCDKATLAPADVLEIAGDGTPLRASPFPPSAETALHVEIVGACDAGAVFHTHSVWSTILGDRHQECGIWLEGYEMLKGLSGVKTHEHREWLPILENSQDMAELAERLGRTLAEGPRLHGVLIRRHGLYSWGADVAEARRHIEILEFLIEIVGRGSHG